MFRELAMNNSLGFVAHELMESLSEAQSICERFEEAYQGDLTHSVKW